jgi:hypothetical protein
MHTNINKRDEIMFMQKSIKNKLNSKLHFQPKYKKVQKLKNRPIFSLFFFLIDQKRFYMRSLTAPYSHTHSLTYSATNDQTQRPFKISKQIKKFKKFDVNLFFSISNTVSPCFFMCRFWFEFQFFRFYFSNIYKQSFSFVLINHSELLTLTRTKKISKLEKTH